MPLVLADRVRETTTTTGTGTISLAGPVSGFQGFSTAIGNANTTYYTIVDAATGAWEVGLGTYTSSGSTLARTTVLSSSNSDALVPFASGTKDVFVTQPAERAVYVLGAGTGLAAGAAAFTANGVPYASATNTLTTGSALTYSGGALLNTGSFAPTDGTNIGEIKINAATLDFNTSSSAVPQVFRLGSSEQMRLTSTGLGIGTSSPAYKLDVAGDIALKNNATYLYSKTSGGTVVRMLGLNSANTAYVGPIDAGPGDMILNASSSSTNIQFYASGSEQMRLTSTGLGIGTSSPASKLHIDGNFIRIEQSGANTAYFGNAADLVSGAPAGAAIRFNNTALRIAFGSTQIAMFDSSGNLGIGTSSPPNKLTVSNAGANGFEFDPASSLMQTYNRSGGAYTTMNLLALSMAFKTGASPATTMLLDSSGNLGIGTTNPQQKLVVSNSGAQGLEISPDAVASAPALVAYNRSGGAYVQLSALALRHVWQAGASPTEAMRLDSSGNLGIGTSSPSSFSGYTTVSVNNATNGGIYNILVNGTETARLQAYSGIFNVAAKGAATNLTFETNGTERMRLDSSGNLGLGVTPSAWSGYSAFQFGQRGAVWANQSGNDVYLSANYYFGAGSDRYIATGAASYYKQNAGVHSWGIAASGTAGDPITFTQAMTLDASGNLGLGATSVTALGSGYTTQAVQGTNGAGFRLYAGATEYGRMYADSGGAYLQSVGASTPIVFLRNAGAESARITSGGYSKFSNDGNYTGVANTYHEFYQTANNTGLYIRSTNGSYTATVLECSGDRATTNTSYYLFDVYNGNVSGRFRVADSGNATNTNGSYGTISDAKMKTDILDAGSQWADIKAIRFRKFKMKDDPAGLVQLGVVAQELEQTSPGLVEQHTDRDAEGNDLGTTTKSVKTSVLLMKAAVALQEAMARIEKLEAEVATLKGA